MKTLSTPSRRFHPAQISLLALVVIMFATLPQVALATANYVYHERTVNDPGCGGQYVTTLTPNSAQPHPLRWKIEYQFYTDNTRVYYTTDGSTPSGALGTPTGTTTVLTGSYTCTFGSPVVDVASATIPAQPAGTVVKYIISAWHSGGGPEIFANSGEFSSPFTTSTAATVFTYTVSSTPQAAVLVESRTSSGTLTANPPYVEGGTGANWADTTSKSTAGGGLVATGARFATAGTPFFTITPTLTPGVTYNVQSTLPAASASADIVINITTSGLSASTLPGTTTSFRTANGNVWSTLGTITPSSASPTITFTYGSGTLTRFYADAIRFLPVTSTGPKTWNGGGAANFWTTGLNWGGTPPNPSGDALIFSGVTRTNPVMDGPYSVTSLSFNSAASNFFITAVGGNLVIGSAGITNVSLYDQTVASPIAQGSTALNVMTGTKTTTVNGLLTGTGGYNATGSGTLYVSNSGNTISGAVSVSGGATLRLPASSSIGSTTAGSGNVTLNGGTFRNDDAGAANVLLTQNRQIIVGASGGAINLANSSQILLSSNVFSGSGNTLTINGPGELRILTNLVNSAGGRGTFAKLVIDAAMFTLGHSSSAATEDSLGAVPSVTTDDAITLQNGGRLRNNVSTLTLDSKRGITIGTGGGTIRAVSPATLTIPSAIKGANTLTIGGGSDTGIIALASSANTFSAINITTGTLQLNTAGAIPDAATVTVSSGGTLNLNAINETVGNVVQTAGFISGAGSLTGTIFDLRAGTNSATMAGPGALSKTTTSTLRLTGTNTFSGNVTNSAGTISINDSSAPFGNGTGTIILSGGNISVSVDRGVSANNIVNPLLMTANTEFQAPTTTGTRNLTFGGPLTGTAGTLTLHNTSGTAGPAAFNVRFTNSFSFDQPITSVIDTAGNTNQMEIWNRADLGAQTYNGVISGPLVVRRSITTANTGGKVIFNAVNTYSGFTSLNDGEIGLGSDCTGPADAPTGGPLGTGPLSLGNDGGKLSASGTARNLKNHVIFTTGGKTLTFVGANDLEVSGNVDLATFNISLINSNSGNCVISGPISNGGLTKLGPGSLSLTTANTYTGATIVSNGLLRVDGSLAAGSSVTVSGGTLGGSGSVNGPVSVLVAGKLAPSISIGTLNINNTLSLAGTTMIELDKAAGQTSDKVLGVTTLTEGGALQVANIGGPLAAGDSFPVFSASTYTGSFASVTPAPGAGLAWDTEKLRTNGVLLVHNQPIAGDDVASAYHGQTTTIPVFKLLANDTGEPGEILSIIGVGPNASLGGGFVTYTAPSSGTNDVINYTLSDGRGGTNTGTINVTLTTSASFNQLSAVDLGNGDVQLTFLGIPGTNYALDRTFNLTPPVTWAPQITNPAADNGYLIFTNTPDPSTNNFWRTRYVP